MQYFDDPGVVGFPERVDADTVQPQRAPRRLTPSHRGRGTDWRVLPCFTVRVEHFLAMDITTLRIQDEGEQQKLRQTAKTS